MTFKVTQGHLLLVLFDGSHDFLVGLRCSRILQCMYLVLFRRYCHLSAKI